MVFWLIVIQHRLKFNVDICQHLSYHVFDICQEGDLPMPRTPRCRFIDGYPEYWRFTPMGADRDDMLIMTLDEYETIRLIDKCGLTQEQCAGRMGVARTTVTAIYDSARKKLADSLIDGKTLQIGGGHYRLNSQGTDHVIPKGENDMRIAVTYDNGTIFQHFGHTQQFKLYDTKEGKLTAEQVVGTNGHGHGALAGFLKEAGVDALICGGIGMGAQNALAEAGIQLFAGVTGEADQAAHALMEGALHYDPNATCDHHGHGEGHTCHNDGHTCHH